MGSQEHPRYSHKALRAIRQARDAGRLDEVRMSRSPWNFATAIL
jgi:hypothetical protein